MHPLLRQSVLVCRKCTAKYCERSEHWVVQYNPQLPEVLRDGSRQWLSCGVGVDGRAAAGEQYLSKALYSSHSSLQSTAPLHRSETENSQPPQDKEGGPSQLQNCPQRQLSLLFRLSQNLIAFPDKARPGFHFPFSPEVRTAATGPDTSCLLIFVLQTASQGTVTYH